MEINKRPTNYSESKWFWKWVEEKNGCWVWTRSKNNLGYGITQWKNKSITAHCLAFLLIRGPKPKGLELDHLCRNRACVNPFHLDPVTHRENILRGQSPSAFHAKKTHCPKGHPFKGLNLRFKIKDGKIKQRVCRTCTGWGGLNA